METVIYLLFGLLLGVLSLPLKRHLDNQAGVLLYLIAWSGLWLLFMPFALWFGLKAYRDAWYRYLDRREAARYQASQD